MRLLTSSLLASLLLIGASAIKNCKKVMNYIIEVCIVTNPLAEIVFAQLNSVQEISIHRYCLRYLLCPTWPPAAATIPSIEGSLL